MNRTCSIKIGPLTITFSCPTNGWHAFLVKHYRPFLAAADEKCDARIAIVRGELPSRKMLSLSVKGASREIRREDFFSASNENLSLTTLRIEKNKYSFDSWLRVFFTLDALRHRGLLVHGAGIFFDGCTFLFPGRSGKGKSTIVRILGKKTALSDELTFIHMRARAAFAASTPFWGELKKGTGALYHAPLKALCFLEHGETIRLERITEARAARLLLETVLFFARDPVMMEKLLSVAAGIVRTVPAYRLVFSRHSTRRELRAVLEGIQGGRP